MQRPKVGVGVIIAKDNKVLMLKRKNAHGEGTWSFAGGHLEAGEEIQDCAKREALEETGLTVNSVQIVGVTNDIFKEEDKHYITIFTLCQVESGTEYITEPDKCSEIKWFAWNNLPKPLFLTIEHLLEQGYHPFR